MPLYEYECDVCAHRFERIQKFSDPLVDACPRAAATSGSCSRRPPFQFKGTGFYITDYPKKTSTTRTRAATRRATRSPLTRSRRIVRQQRRCDSASSASTATKTESKSESKSTKSRVASRSPTADSEDDGAPSSEPAALLAYRSAFRSMLRRYSRELLGEVRPPQREVDDRLQEPELVAGVVADAVDVAAVDRPLLQQAAQAVGQLDLAGAIASRSRRARGRCPASGCSGR